MKIPESIRIGGVEYPVGREVNLNDGLNMCYGHIDYERCHIRLLDSPSMSHEKKCITLWHEILHGIRQHAGLEIEDEEAVVNMFAKGIYQVLQDNGGRLFDIREPARCTYGDRLAGVARGESEGKSHGPE